MLLDVVVGVLGLSCCSMGLGHGKGYGGLGVC